MLGRSSGNHDWLLANASACVSCGFRLRNARNASDCVWMETGLKPSMYEWPTAVGVSCEVKGTGLGLEWPPGVLFNLFGGQLCKELESSKMLIAMEVVE